MFSLHIWTSTFCLHFTLPSFFRDQVSRTEFRGPNFGDRIPGTEFRGPDFGGWILGTGFQKEAKSNQFFLNFELCSVYISLLISTSIFCLHLTLPSFFRDWVSGTGFWGLDFRRKPSQTNSFKFGGLFTLHISTYLYFYFLSSLDITFLFQGPVGTGFGIMESRFVQSTYLDFYFLSSLYITFLFQGPGFGDRISGTEFRGPDFGDWISEGSQVKPILLKFWALSSVYISLLISIYVYFYFLSSLNIWHYLPVSGTRFQVLNFRRKPSQTNSS